MTWEFIIYIITLLAIIIAIRVYYSKTGLTKEQFDERQSIIRGKAYKYSAFSMFLCAILYYIVSLSTEKRFTEEGVSCLILACIGAAVFAVYSIFNDSFFVMKSRQRGTGRPGVYAVLLAVIIAVNGFSAIRNIREHEMIKDGILTAQCVNLVLAILFLVILISMGIKYYIDTRAEQGEQ